MDENEKPLAFTSLSVDDLDIVDDCLADQNEYEECLERLQRTFGK